MKSSKPPPMGQIADRIVQVARGYIGQQELPQNSGFKDPAFQAKMLAIGWNKGESWCSFQAELIWTEALQGHPLAQHLPHLFSGSTISTYANFKASPFFKTGQLPRKGAVVIWRHGGPGSWLGHAGVVTEVTDGIHFLSVEGNTNKDGGREGIETDEKSRVITLYKPNQLNLLGFIYAPED